MWALTPPSQLPPRWGWWTLHFQGSLPLPPAPSQGQWYLAGMGRLSACLIHPKDQRLLTALPSCRYPSPKAWVSCRENPPLSLIPAPGTYNCPNNSEKNGIKMKDSKTAWLRNPHEAARICVGQTHGLISTETDPHSRSLLNSCKGTKAIWWWKASLFDKWRWKKCISTQTNINYKLYLTQWTKVNLRKA